MRKGTKIVEQVDSNGNIFMGCDFSLSKKEIQKIIADYFPNIKNNNEYFEGEYNSTKYSILIKNITYLGNPHPKFKKRIQISGLPEFYDYSIKHNLVPLLLGIYKNGDTLLFCDFYIKTYLEKKSHNSSAHVYTDDLASVYNEDNPGIFQKKDYFNNIITVFRPDYIDSYLKNKFITEEFDTSINDALENYIKYTTSKLSNNPNKVIKFVFDQFFSYETKTWNGIDCYKEMYKDNYKNKFQCEWPGFYLEYKFEKFVNHYDISDYVKYAQDKKKDGIDLDLLFPSLNSFGDLKAHSSNSRAVQGNDETTIYNLLSSTTYNHHIYYIVCEHDTLKDKDCDYVVTRFWNKLQGKDKKGKELSYGNKMKNSVKLKKYFILDINNSNKKYLKTFRQGINSNGNLREPKILIDVDSFKYFELNCTSF